MKELFMRFCSGFWVIINNYENYRILYNKLFWKKILPVLWRETIQKKNITIYRKGDKDFSKYAWGKYSLFATKCKVTTYSYVCPNCDEEFDDYEVCLIRRLQKESKTKILRKDKPSDLE